MTLNGTNTKRARLDKRPSKRSLLVGETMIETRVEAGYEENVDGVVKHRLR